MKIGSTKNLTDRLSAYFTHNPIPVQLVLSARGGQVAEQAIHAYLKAHRHRGEWFHRTPEVEDFVSWLQKKIPADEYFRGELDPKEIKKEEPAWDLTKPHDEQGDDAGPENKK